MEAVFLHGSLDRQKSVRNSKKIQQTFISSPYDYSENYLLPSNFHSMGLQQAPPLFSPHHHLRPPSQPPLLPLPAAHPRLAFTGRALSLPPANKNSYNKSLSTPKKSKSANKNLKKQEKNLPKFRSQEAFVWPSSTNDPINVADNVRSLKEVGNNIDVGVLAGSKIFLISPPPSSLPLPSFCFRTKLKCGATAMAAGVDINNGDNLRRFLQLQ